MATLFPDLETIKNFRVKPTEGELRLLTFLNANLDSSFEIYFQPFLNGDNPDIIVMKKNAGVLIFEVKDWNLSSYRIDNTTKWRLINNDAYIKSPLRQVMEYKDNLFNLHIETLLERRIKNKFYIAVVNCALYFHNESESALKNFILKDFQSDNFRKYRKSVSYISLLGKDSLTPNRLQEILNATRLNQSSLLFTEDLYKSFNRYLKPPYHRLEEGIQFEYTKIQEELTVSKAASKQKIKGVAGCGKTLVLAKRAVNAHLRTRNKVLILTYNLSLKNYIHDRINDVRANFPWDSFYITNYHQFFKSQANNYSLPIKTLTAWQDTNFFESKKYQIVKYSAIFIDEVQDYQTEWLDIITKYFLSDDGEFVVFGDEKQNIYERPLDDNKEPIIRTVVGRWNRSMNASKRFTSNIAKLAQQFQKRFFVEKYNLDEFTIAQTSLDFDTKAIEYYYFKEIFTPEYVSRAIYQILTKFNISPSDAGLLNSKVEFIRRLDYLIRNNKREKTKTTFETQEVHDHLEREIKQQHSGKDESQLEHLLNERLEDIRKYKKNHFWMNTGTMKLSTIHSFKGWEIHTLFLIIENEDEQNIFGTNELIYTGLTRARVNLFILNLGNGRFHDFFKSLIEDSYSI